MKVPYKKKSYVVSFCRYVCPGSKPIYVPVDALPNKPINECFSIVPEHIASHGGEQKLGWSIWHWPKVFIEAEFHCIWKRPDGVLVDITPNLLPFDQILFLPDPHRHYEGRQIDNIRKPISNDLLVKQFIALAEERYREMNKGDLANQHGHVAVSARIGEIDYEMTKIGLTLTQKFGPAFGPP
jgi:hypothetical protein